MKKPKKPKKYLYLTTNNLPNHFDKYDITVIKPSKNIEFINSIHTKKKCIILWN